MNKDIFSIKNKIFVITGGLGQLGQIFINTILSRNCKVAVLDIINEDDNLVSDLIRKGSSKNLIYFSYFF